MADMSYAEGDYAQAKSYLSRYHSRAGFSPQSLWLAMSIEQALGDEAARQVYADILLSRFGESNEARQFKYQ
jgi:Tfp pilus assembly protein PilF